MLLQTIDMGQLGYMDMSTATGILITVLIFIINLIIMTIFLKLALGMIDKAKNTEFGSVFVTSLLMVLCLYFFMWLLGLIGLIIGVILVFVILGGRHNISFLTAILVAIVAFILFIIVMFIIMIFVVGALIVLF